MRRWIPSLLALSLSLVAPLAAVSETVRVRAGEHGTFTRVVLEFSEIPNWTAGRTETGYVVRITSEREFTFDTSNAFRTIGRDRVSGVGEQNEIHALDVNLGCDCAAEIFEVGRNRLVLDIRPRPFGAWAKHEDWLFPGMEQFDTFVVENIEWVASVEDREESSASGFLDHTLNRLDPPPLIVGNFVETISQSDATARDLSKSKTIADLPTTRIDAQKNTNAIDALSSQLSRAISQGLVEKSEEPRSMSEETKPSESGDDESQNFRSLTIFDRDTSASEAFSESTPTGNRCIDGRAVRLNQWGNPAGAGELGELRRAAIAEDGNITEAGRLALARYFLILGFGSEAKHLAQGLPDGLERHVIEAIGDILDEGRSQSRVFDGQLTCQGDVALWALLSRPAAQVDLPPSTDQILASFSALPRHLRSHLGPVLSERLRQAGEPENARTALNAVTRAGGGSRRQDLTEARLALLGTNAPEARSELERLTRGTDFTSAEALLELLLDAERRGVAPRAAWVDDAPSLIRATQGTEVSDTLSYAALRGHVPLMRFDALRRSLNSEVPGLTAEKRTTVAQLALLSLSKIESDSEFIRSEIGFSSFVGIENLPEFANLGLIQRLNALGLDERALKYLPLEDETPEAILLTAKVFVETGEIEQALNLLASREEPQFLAIRAMIFEIEGEQRRAAETYLFADDAERAALKALQAADWEWLAEAETTQTGQYVRSLHGSGFNPDLKAERVAEFADLISRSETRRATAQSLLEVTAVESASGS